MTELDNLPAVKNGPDPIQKLNVACLDGQGTDQSWFIMHDGGELPSQCIRAQGSAFVPVER